ncbi:SdpI family protein [Flavobacteriaceae bacterium 14752]|uniref:SdpI family protein n=1 Tax=Mesohalobacter salilacus TaxID=2491711 RepID=UPI000F63F8F7|nr:SdpI family protein [Flavobacteriaceae bacterium 14752]
MGYLIFSSNTYPFFYNPIFLGLISTGIIFVVAGLILLKNPPKEINWLYGYRSKTSMKNQKIWDFAQTYSAKVMMKLGLALIFISLLGLIYTPTIEIALMLTLVVIILNAVLLVYLVEKKLKT